MTTMSIEYFDKTMIQVAFYKNQQNNRKLPPAEDILKMVYKSVSSKFTVIFETKLALP